MENKKKKRMIWIIVIAVVVAAGILIAVFASGGKELKLSTREAVVDVLETMIMATGYVQPVDKIDVGTQVSGVIEKIYVDFNSQVKKGQLLAELDKLTLNERVTQAQAAFYSSQADLDYAQQNYDRTKLLYDEKAATQVAFEETQNRLVQAKTSLANSQAALHQANVNLSYADITSPIDGVVLSRAVEEGQTVASSFNTPTLFTIANDLTKMQVEADVDEADIGKVAVGQRSTFYVDAFPEDIFEGTVTQVRLQPVVTSNVVTYTVVIEAPNPEEKLYPGMTANINIINQSEEGIMIPVEALYYKMTPEVMRELNIDPSQYGEPAQGEREVWVKKGTTAELRKVQVGLQDGVSAVITNGVARGEEVILSASYEKAKKQGKAAANPLIQRAPRRR